jgi:hypothetical protein
MTLGRREARRNSQVHISALLADPEKNNIGYHETRGKDEEKKGVKLMTKPKGGVGVCAVRTKQVKR